MLAELMALTLVCDGIADTRAVDRSTATMTDGLNTRSAHGTTTRAVRVPDRLWIEVQGQSARIKAPTSITPAAAGRTDDGWRPVSDLAVTDERISGKFSFNWVNSPAFSINRMTGEIEVRGRSFVSGQTDFSGRCQPFEKPRERLF